MYHTNPENGLLKAIDLERVGQDEAALEALNIILASRRYRTWQPVHEKIMEKYIELSIKLRTSMRDAFVKYRSICQDTNVTSLENIINLYRNKAEARAELAREEAEKANSVEIDADFEESPGSIMLQAVSGENAEDRMNQQILTPWIRHLWEGYRTILEILRNNARLQHVYQNTARQAFNFCLKFKRPMEFRRLCDMLRKHLATILKYQHQANSVDLNSPDTQRMYLETRFQQLETASTLELWQEAYRTIEDIHESMQLTKVPQTPSLMKTYYHQLAKIFWASGNNLFHAYSISKFYALRCNEGIEGQEKQDLATAVLLATLSIEPTREGDGNLADSDNEENLRLASMLGFRKESPTRRRLIQGLLGRGILGQVSEVARKIYSLTEEEFGPLALSKKLAPLVQEISNASENIARYVAPLNKLCVVRILQQLAKVYKTMKFDKLMAIVPEMTFLQLERVIMECVRFGKLSMRIDHRTKMILFNDEGMDSQRMRSQLNKLAIRLQKVAEKIQPPVAEDKARERRHVFQSVERGIEEEHKEVFKRKQEIELRKQEFETRQIERENKQQQVKLEQQKKRQEEERVRLEQERVARQAEKAKREEEERKFKEKEALAQKAQAKIAGKGKAAKKLAKIAQNVEKVDKAAIMKAQAELEQSQKLAAERKIKENIKKLDYITRALRLEEKELLVKHLGEKYEQEKSQREADFKKFLETHKANHAKALQEKERLGRMAAAKDNFYAKIMAKRQVVYEKEKAAQDAEIERRRIKREEELAIQRAKEEERRKQEEIERKEAEERRQKEEAEAAERAAKLAAEREANAERQRKLDEIARKQREREAEIEAREAERRKPREEERAPRRGGFDRWGGGAERERGGADTWRRGGDEREGDSSNDRWGRGAGDDRPSGFGAGRPTAFGRRDDREEDGEPRRGGFGDRERPRDRDEGERWGRGGDRDRDSAFGRRDRDDGERWGRGGDRDRESGFGRSGDRDRDSGFGRGGDRDRDSAFGRRDRDDGGRWGRGGDRDRESGFGRGGDRDRESGFGRGGDRDRESGFGRGGDRDRESGFGRGGDRDRESGFGRGGDRDRESGFGRGGDRDRESGFGRGGDRDRESGFGRRGARNDPPSKSDMGGWRDRSAPSVGPEKAHSAPPAAAAEPTAEDDGFTVVTKGSRRKR